MSDFPNVQPVPQPQKSSNALLWILGCLVAIPLILVLCACLMVIILAVMGPAIGNSFDNIITTLGVPTSTPTP